MRKRYLVLCLLLVACVAVQAAPSALVPEVGCRAEWDQPTDILVHTPGAELFAGVIHPEAALFERAFDLAGAAAEHRNYLSLLQRNGARVHTVVGALLAGTVDGQGRALLGRELDALRRSAREFITIDATALLADQQAEQGKYLDKTLGALHPRELVDIILQCPTVRLRPSLVPNTRYSATYEFSPVMNLYVRIRHRDQPHAQFLLYEALEIPVRGRPHVLRPLQLVHINLAAPVGPCRFRDVAGLYSIHREIARQSRLRSGMGQYYRKKPFDTQLVEA